MFVGHFAAGFAAKRVAPEVSLGTLILAAAFPDVLWIVFFATGIERVGVQPGIMVANSLDLVYIPFSHSLVMNAVWGGLFAGVYLSLRHDRRGASILFAVASLDYSALELRQACRHLDGGFNQTHQLGAQSSKKTGQPPLVD